MEISCFLPVSQRLRGVNIILNSMSQPAGGTVCSMTLFLSSPHTGCSAGSWARTPSPHPQTRSAQQQERLCCRREWNFNPCMCFATHTPAHVAEHPQSSRALFGASPDVCLLSWTQTKQRQKQKQSVDYFRFDLQFPLISSVSHGVSAQHCEHPAPEALLSP